MGTVSRGFTGASCWSHASPHTLTTESRHGGGHFCWGVSLRRWQSQWTGGVGISQTGILTLLVVVQGTWMHSPCAQTVTTFFGKMELISKGGGG